MATSISIFTKTTTLSLSQTESERVLSIGLLHLCIQHEAKLSYVDKYEVKITYQVPGILQTKNTVRETLM